MPPLVIEDESDMLLAITAAGRMLMFPVSDLPQLSKGKGNKIISIPAAEAAAGQTVWHICLFCRRRVR